MEQFSTQAFYRLEPEVDILIEDSSINSVGSHLVWPDEIIFE